MAGVPKRARLVERFHALDEVEAGGSPIDANVHPRLLFSTVSPTPDSVSDALTRINVGGEWNANYISFVSAMDTIYGGYDPTADDKARIARRAFNAAFIYYFHSSYAGGSTQTKADWLAKAKVYLAELRRQNFAQTLTSVTKNGSNMRVVATGHGLVTGRLAGVHGCNEPEYNFGGPVTVIDANTFELPFIEVPAGSTATGAAIRWGTELGIVNSGQQDLARLVAYTVDLLWDGLTTLEKHMYGPGWLMLGENDSTVSNVFRSIQTLTEVVQAKWPNNHFVETASSLMTTALLYKGAGILDSWANNVYTNWYSTAVRGTDGWMTNNSTRGGVEGSWVQGNVYGLSYNQITIAAMERSWRIANGLTRVDHYPATGAARHLRGYPITCAHHVLPFGEVQTGAPDGRFPRAFSSTHAEYHGNLDGYTNALVATGFFIVASELDGVAQDNADLARWLGEHLSVETDAANAEWWGMTRFCRAKGTAKSPATISLPTSDFLTSGEGFWRTAHVDGTNFNNAAIYLEACKWYAEDPSPVGSIQVNYRGPVICRPNGGGHNPDAIGKFGAANLVGAPDPTRTSLEGTFGPTVPGTGSPADSFDDRGYMRIYQPSNLTLGGGDYNDRIDLTAVKFLGVGENDSDEKFGYAYIPQDRAYNTDTVNDNVVTAVTKKWGTLNRQIAVRLPDVAGTDPLKIWVYDRGTTKSTSYEKRVTWHVGSVPTVDGTSNPGPTRSGSDANKTQYTGATLATVTNSTDGHNNKLWMRFASPTSTIKVVVVNWRRDNGAGQDFLEDPYGLSWEYGTPYIGTSPAQVYSSPYRIELVATTANLTDRFITAMEVTGTADSESTKANITATNYDGYRQGQDIVCFATVDGAETGSITLPASMTNGRLLIANVTPSAAMTFSNVGSGAGADISAMTLASTGASATSGGTASSAGTLELIFTTGAGANRTFSIA